MNQVIIAKQLFTTGAINQLDNSIFSLGFSIDGKTLVNDIKDKECVLLWLHDEFNTGNIRHRLEYKALNIPKNRDITFGLLNDEDTYSRINFDFLLEENIPVDFYVINGSGIPDDKFNIHLDVGEINQETLYDDYTGPITEQLSSVLDNLGLKYNIEISIDGIEYESGRIYASIIYESTKEVNLKIVGKNVEISSANYNFTNPISYIKDLIDKHIQQFGINDREYCDKYYNSLISAIDNFSNYKRIITIRFKDSRVASVTHDEDLYQNIYIICTDAVSQSLESMLGLI